jgi:hypothetical protein
MQSLSRMLSMKSNTLADIFHWIQREFPGRGENYVFGDFHVRNARHGRILKVRTAIFPRLAPDGSLAIMPILFIVKKKNK